MDELGLTLPIDVLRMLYIGASSDTIGIKSLIVTFDQDIITVKHVNDTNSALMNFESRKLNTGWTESMGKIELPIDTSDMKTLLNLAKDVDDITFLIGEGITTCKIGNIKKQFAQPGQVEIPSKSPKFNTSVSVEFNDAQAAEVVSTFSDLKEHGDLKVIINETGVFFSVREDNRATEIEFPASELENFSITSPVESGYDVKMGTALFKTKVKGSTLMMEFGSNVPVKSRQTSSAGTLTILLAPKIYD